MNQCLNEILKIATLHLEKIITWKVQGVILSESEFLRLVEENHAFNFQLWQAEDRARRDDQGAEFVYHAKREIDHCNQQRNNRMEAMDSWLVEGLKPAPASTCCLHSETPGMIIDRLSILSLKVFHMNEQVLRQDVDLAHRNVCSEKLRVLEAQRKDLMDCLTQFINEIADKKRTFKVYYQLKMYNDPNLNPELYNNSQIKVSS